MFLGQTHNCCTRHYITYNQLIQTACLVSHTKHNKECQSRVKSTMIHSACVFCHWDHIETATILALFKKSYKNNEAEHIFNFFVTSYSQCEDYIIPNSEWLILSHIVILQYENWALWQNHQLFIQRHIYSEYITCDIIRTDELMWRWIS